MRVLIVIPAFNEEATIVSVVSKVIEAGYDYIVIDDGSTDSTRKLCLDNGFDIVSLPQNLGIGGAMQTGHRYAFAKGYDADIQFDGDGQHDISYIPHLIDLLQSGADLAIGSRFVEHTDGFQSSAIRRVGIRWLKWWIKLFAGCTITDATSGFRACNRKTIEIFCRYYPYDYPEPESIAYAHLNGCKVKETPVVMHAREGGVSSITGLSGAYYMLKVSMAIIVIRLRKIGRR